MIPRAKSAHGKVRRRIETVLGVTGARLAKYRPTWREVSRIWFQLIWRPHLFGILFFEV